MALEKDLFKMSVQEREYMEIDVKRDFHAVVSRIFKWQIASSEVSDEVYELNKEQYIIEAASLQSKLTEVYLRLEANVVYPLSSSEKKKRDELMEELSYEIDYLSNITPMQTDCDMADALSTLPEQVDTDQQSTALLVTDSTYRIVAAIDLTDDQDTATNSTGHPTARRDSTDRSIINPHSCVNYNSDDRIAAVSNTGRECRDVERAITEEENADITCTGCCTADIGYSTVIAIEELASYTEVPDTYKEDHAAYTAEPDVHKEETVAYPEESAAYKKEHAAYKKEPAAYTEYTEQHLSAWPTAKISTSTNGHSTIMQTQGMIKTASTDSNIEENRDDDIKVWHHPQNEKEAIKTSESMSSVIICCHSDYSNEICYLLLYS